MAEEEDFSSLPLPERFTHKNWKVRKEGYEAAAKEFDKAQDESDPTVQEFIRDSGLWKGAVADSNVAAQQEALACLCSFLQIAGTQGCTRTRGATVGPIAEKALPSTRPAAKQKALEALMLYIELDRPDPIIEDLLPTLSHKTPKVITATLSALISIYHAYGCKTVDPKPVLKSLPKVYGHADKNVRAEAQNLTVELYRWLKDAMKPLFWNELKPVQQQDLEKLFEKVKEEPPPKQERLLRSQQAAAAPAGGDDNTAEDHDVDDMAEIDLEPELEAVDVLPKIPKDLQERLGSSKWKDRKEALDDLLKAISHPLIKEGPFDEILRSLAKAMKDANIMVVITAANCVEAFAKGLRKAFAKYRSVVVSPMLERLKEKKQSVTDAIGAALDAVFMSTTLSDCLTEILEFLAHKNPLVKLEATRFLIRCLKTTRDAPNAEEVKSIAEISTKLMTDSQETQRTAGAEVLGTLMKIMGDRFMQPHLEGLDDIRKAKVKEACDAAEVKAKYKPKSAAPAAKAAPAAAKKAAVGKKPAPKKAPAAAAPPPEPEPQASAPLQPRPTARAGGLPKPGQKSGLAAPSSLRPPGKPTVSGLGRGIPQTGAPSPKRPDPAPLDEPTTQPPPPKPTFAGRGLAGRPLGKPTPPPSETPNGAPSTSSSSSITAASRAELDELTTEVERLRRGNEELRAERTRLTSQLHELQHQNAQLIEDHTRDVLSVKAKETQLVRARSDAEAAETTVQSQAREIERLKRELSRQVRAPSPPPSSSAYRELGGSGSGEIYHDLGGAATGVNGGPGASLRYDSGFSSSGVGGGVASGRSRSYVGSPPGDAGKENLERPLSRTKLSPPAGAEPRRAKTASAGSGGSYLDRGRASPSVLSQGSEGSERQGGGGSGALSRSGSQMGMAGERDGVESWKRAAEVTQNLKARIEMMKVSSI
ncbi:MAG: Microtubule-associated protein, microtubule dynamics during spindle orientation [Bathelium mastoideum]|nr:MAG: Microtubule-associated protein, microtubule dynamics during spindle orientation [Bathelium mastoideum]